jgi:hypothetical protein
MLQTIAGMDLPERVASKILSENAARLLAI